MIRYETTTTIDRPPNVVFAAMLDPERYDRWTDMTDMQFDGDGPVGLGTRGRFRLPRSPIKGDLELEVVELEPGRRVVFRISHPTLTWTAWAETAAEGEGTRFVYGGEMSIHGWRRLLEPMIRSEMSSGEAREADRLKALLEAEAAVAAGA